MPSCALPEGEVVRTTKQLTVGAEAEVVLSDGRATVRTLETHPREGKEKTDALPAT